jgi:hypothetical protein
MDILLKLKFPNNANRGIAGMSPVEWADSPVNWSV